MVRPDGLKGSAPFSIELRMTVSLLGASPSTAKRNRGINEFGRRKAS